MKIKYNFQIRIATPEIPGVFFLSLLQKLHIFNLS